MPWGPSEVERTSEWTGAVQAADKKYRVNSGLEPVTFSTSTTHARCWRSYQHELAQNLTVGE